MNFKTFFVIAAGSLHALRAHEVQAICWLAQPGNTPCGVIDPGLQAARESEQDFDVRLTFTWTNAGRKVHSQVNLRTSLLRTFWEARLLPLYMHFDCWESVQHLPDRTKQDLLHECLNYISVGHTEASYRRLHGIPTLVAA